MSRSIRIFLADDHPIVLDGLNALVSREVDMTVVGSATSGAVALRSIHELSPDVAVLDISMPGLSGIQIAHKLVESGLPVRIIILSLHEDRGFVRQSLDVGAQGYVLKRSASTQLIKAIRGVYVGGMHLDPEIADVLTSVRKDAVDVPREQRGGLTERELAVMRLVALGHSNKEIAFALDIGIKSVETYKARGSAKLELKTRADIVRYAAVNGWLGVE